MLSMPLLINHAHRRMKTESELVKPGRWQSLDVSDKPEMATHEVQNFHAKAGMMHATIQSLQRDCQPSLPWAEDHFLERVCGEPLNPGNTWTSWPYAHKADTFRDALGRFNHNYMERYWPKYAGQTDDGSIHETWKNNPDWVPAPHFGIRNPYGDFEDVVQLFVKDPLTRQAYVPIFFPEDTGGAHGGRIPCTLGYHFMIRRGQMHIVYFMRSCDLRRHYNDDIYLTARFNLWLIDQLRAASPGVFDALSPGTLTVFISSLHIFRNDWRDLYGDFPTPGDLAAETAVVAAEHLAKFSGKPSGGDGASSRFSGGKDVPDGYSFGGQQIRRDEPKGSVELASVGGDKIKKNLLSGDTHQPWRRQRPDGTTF